MYNLYLSSASLNSMHFLQCLSSPYAEGWDNIALKALSTSLPKETEIALKALKQKPQSHCSLWQKVKFFSAGILLLIPLVNSIVWIALRHLCTISPIFIEKTQNELKEEFDKLNPCENYKLLMLCQKSMNGYSKAKSQWPTFDKTLFTVKNDQDFYYNASKIKSVTGSEAVTCEDPSTDNQNTFLKVLWESKAATVITLSKDCSQYWPALSHFRSFANFYIYNTGETLLFENKICKRILEIVHNDQHRKIVQYHLINPKSEFYAEAEILAFLIKQFSKDFSENRRNFLIHCRNGIGLTGAFLTAFEVYQKLLENKRSPDILSETVKHLRSPDWGRLGFVLSFVNYLNAYQTVKKLTDI